MNVMLGGIIIASPDDTQTTAVAKGLSYPAFTIPGMRITPMAATVAAVEPLTAPQKTATPIAAMASPPVSLPTSSLMNTIIFSAILALSIMFPASMKKGTASNGYFTMFAKKL